MGACRIYLIILDQEPVERKVKKKQEGDTNKCKT